MNKKAKTILLSTLGVLLIIAIIVGTTYAFWRITKVQEGEANSLTTTCLGVDLTSMSNGINLQTQFPITDEEGRKTEGYTFKISNKCNTYVSYDINLESLNNVTEANRLNSNNLVAIIDDGNVLQLGYYPTTSSALKTNEGTAYDTRKLVTDTLSPGSTSTPTSKEYTLRVWLDEDASTDAANKEWNGKISITASPVIAENAVAKLTELAKTNTEEMFTDDTADANIRYMGADPANYVTFSNESYSEDLYYGYDSEDFELSEFKEYTSLEACQVGIDGAYNTNCTKIHSKGDPILWRVIGIMNNVDDGTGNKETRLKIIRDANIGQYQWDAKCNSINDGNLMYCDNNLISKNNWGTATLNQILNDGFYNSSRTKELYPDQTFAQNGQRYWTLKYLDFTNNGIKIKNRNLIEDAVYYLGGTSGVSTDSEYYYENKTVHDYYSIERSNNVYGENPITWTGIVGLIYPSDYGYATSGGEAMDKNTCTNAGLTHIGYDDDCTYNNWLSSTEYYWLITPQSNLSNAAAGQYYGMIDIGYYTYNVMSTRPVVYLKSDVKIMGGDGTKENPYKLGL